jgi:thiamine-monophosphate kinase
MMRVRDIGEIGLIKRLSKGIKLDSSVIHGIGDDTAVIKWNKDKYLLFTCDMLIEGVHFKAKKATPFQIGWKALGRNLSDIAAMGGIPRYALVSIAVRPDSDVRLLDGIYKGIKALAGKFGVNIVGGDMAHSSKTVIDVSLVGEAEKKRLVMRSGAKPGDVIFVTGSIGGSLKGKHLKFTPRVAEARMLVRKYKLNSMIDISDGLLLDLGRVLDSSHAGACIFEDLIPLSKNAGSFDKAVSDGEDFELLFTMGEKEANRLIKHGLKGSGLPIYIIGRIMEHGRGLSLVRANGAIENIKPKGYLHF